MSPSSNTSTIKEFLTGPVAPAVDWVGRQWTVEPKDPNDILLDLSLPQQVIDVLKTPLDAMYWHLENTEFFDVRTASPRKYTSIKYYNLERVLLHVPSDILVQGISANQVAVSTIARSFKGKTKDLFICCADCPPDFVLPLAFQSIMSYWKDDYDINYDFISWKNLLELKDMSLEEQKRMLGRVTLKLDELRSQHEDEAPSKELKDQLIDELSNLPVTESYNGRTGLLDGIPGADTLNRNENIKRQDLDQIVTQLAKLGRLANGQMPVVKLIDNALPSARGYEGEGKLRAIRQQLT